MRWGWLALAVVLAVPAAALQLGDDVVGFYRTQAKLYSASRSLQTLFGYPGYETAVLATDAEFTKPPYVLVLRKVGGAVVVPFGTVEGAAAQAELLLDTDGDGRLDGRTVKNLVPSWLVLRTPGPRGDGKAFRALLDRIYRQYDQSSGPVPAQLALLMDNLRTRASDGANADRDLDQALVSALDQALAEPALTAGTLKALSAALQTRGGDHPLPLLYRGEALVSLGLANDAKAAFDRLTVLDPRSTIGAFKKAQNDVQAVAAFRRLHPDFWASRP